LLGLVGLVALAASSTARATDGALAADAAIDAASGDAAADVSDGAPAAVVDVTLERVAVLARQVQAIKTLLAGALPAELYTTELFQVDLLDDAAVMKRKKALEKEIAARRADGGGALGVLDASPDAALSPRDEAALLEIELATLRLSFLSKPHAERQAVLQSETARRRTSREEASAAAARKKAEEQQRQADEAQRAALDEASREHDATLRALANERARAEGLRSDLAEQRQAFADERSRESARTRERSTRMFELTDAARKVVPGSADADALYDRLVAQLELERADLDAALDAHATPPKAPRYVPDPAVLASDDPATAAQRAQLEATSGELAKEAASLEDEKRALAWSRLGTIAERERQLNAARLSLLDELSSDKRGRVLGFGGEGIAQLRREIFDVRLVARWRMATGARDARAFASSLKTPGMIIATLAKLLFLALLVVATSFARARGARAAAAVRGAVARAFHRAILGRVLQALLSILEALARPLALLAAVVLAPRIFGFSTAEDAATGAAYGIVRAFAFYRLIIVASHALITRAAGRPVATLALAGGRSDKVLRSLHVIGRYALFVSVLLTLSVAMLGAGYLYHVVLRFAWLGALPIAFVLIRWWRSDIASAYVERRAKGALADAVRNSETRWYGFFVAVVAVGFLFVGWVAAAARRFVLGFEQSRKALAYLFRRRLEKRADEGEAPDVGALPAALREAFEPHTPRDGEAIDRYPGLARFTDAFAAWLARRDAIGAHLIVGRTGYGKTSWIEEALRRAPGVPTRVLTLDARVLTPLEVIRAIASLLDVDPAAVTDVASLARAASAGARRLVVVDDIQNFFLRGVGGLEAWRAFNDLVPLIGDRVFWLCACAHYPNDYLAWARRNGDVFRSMTALAPWTEPQIAELIKARMAFSGFEAVYDDLVIEDGIEGVDTTSQVANTGADYMRLLWDYSEGSPRVALDCWLHSLVLDPDHDKRMRVRLFRQPNLGYLETLTEVRKFVLAGVIWHESLTPREAARSLQFTPASCDATLVELWEHGVLTRLGDRYRVAIAWWPPVIRYLRRKHLVDS
jgi:hypothetical protein